MAQKDWPAGVIRKTPVTPAGPYQNGAASGVWTLDQATYWLKQGLWPIAGNTLQRALFATRSFNTIEYFNITTLGNAASFGTITSNATLISGLCSSSTRALLGGTYPNTAVSYVTVATTGNTTYFGDLIFNPGPASAGAALSNETRGIFTNGSSNAQTGYVTIATLGNGAAFGDLLTVVGQPISYGGTFASTTRGVYSGGQYFDLGTSTFITSNTIQYVTIATAGNWNDFGDVTVARTACAGCSSSTRGLTAGGSTANGFTVYNIIDYITIASTGNAADFGDLLSNSVYLAGTSSSTRGVFVGGYVSGANTNVISYVTIASAGNAADFGDLINASRTNWNGATSNCHGGI